MHYRKLGDLRPSVSCDPKALPHDDVLDLLLGPTHLLQDPRDPIDPNNQKEVRAIAVSSLNGSSSFEGASGSLGNSLDFKLLFHLRAWADVVIVGTRTIIKEKYCGVKLNEFYRSQRRDRGQEETPPIGILSSSLPFVPESKIFVDTVVPPIIITDLSNAVKAETFGHLCRDIVVCDTSDPCEIVEHLRNRGYNRILLEGGPTTLKSFFSQGLVDVFHHTVDPSIITPNIHPLVPSEDEADTTGEQIQVRFHTEDVVVTNDGVIFVRYVRP